MEIDSETFLALCKESGVKVTPGTGKIFVAGEEIKDIKAYLDRAFPSPTHAKEKTMLQFLTGDMFACGADVLVNPINTVGVMGKGLALYFRKHFPQMFLEYRELCLENKLDYGINFWWYSKEERVWVCNMPTKRDWRNRSSEDGVKRSLQAFHDTMFALSSHTTLPFADNGISLVEHNSSRSFWSCNGGNPYDINTVAMPAVGCGLGGLDFQSFLVPFLEGLFAQSTVKQNIYVFAPKEFAMQSHINVPCSQPAGIDTPRTWTEAIATAIGQTPSEVANWIRSLEAGIQNLRNQGQEIFPPQNLIFNAYKLTPPTTCKVVLIGQDPYHDHGQAMGLSFSVPDGVPLPPSLKNIFTELCDDCGCAYPQSGDLTPWAKQGVLLLNSSLSVEAHKANSHAKYGWDRLTSATVLACLKLRKPIVFILWGSNAQKVVDQAISQLSETERNALLTNKCFIKSVHPSPLSAYRGFFGSKPFSKANEFLMKNGIEGVNWNL